MGPRLRRLQAALVLALLASGCGGDGPGPGGGKADMLGGRPFFGGSAFISTGCIVWPDINLAAVIAVNAGGANDAVREAFAVVKQREAGT